MDKQTTEQQMILLSEKARRLLEAHDREVRARTQHG